jgi:hypothetical protein
MGTVLANLEAWKEGKKVALAAYGQMIAAPKLEAYAKANRPWRDQSSAARAGLKGGAVFRGNKVVVYIAHSVSYGPYLEVCNDGRYAILDPTIEANVKEIYEGYRRIMLM